MASLGALVIELRECLERIREHGDAYYVYVLRRPDGTPFYVGKGRYNRIARHEYDALKTRKKSYRLNVIRQVVAQGGRIGYEITCFYAEPSDALAAEIDLIQKIGRRDLGTGPLTNKTDGGDGWLNPSPEQRAFVSAVMKKRMREGPLRDAAMDALESSRHSPVRKARQAESAKTPEYRAIQSALSKARWFEKREAMIAAQRASRNDDYRRKQMDGVRRVQADPEFHRKRNAGLRRYLDARRRARVSHESAGIA